jgi:hypothetical protein
MVVNTALLVEGDTARQRMAIARCLAGSPHDPLAAGA